MMFAMVGAAAWLISPDPTLASQVRAPPAIPQRIAESIERKLAPLPEPLKETSVMRPVSGSMREVPVSLTQPARHFKIRETSPTTNKKVKRKLRDETATTASKDAPVAQPLPTARTDFPY